MFSSGDASEVSLVIPFVHTSWLKVEGQNLPRLGRSHAESVARPDEVIRQGLSYVHE